MFVMYMPLTNFVGWYPLKALPVIPKLRSSECVWIVPGTAEE